MDEPPPLDAAQYHVSSRPLRQIWWVYYVSGQLMTIYTRYVTKWLVTGHNYGGSELELNVLKVYETMKIWLILAHLW
jgi:hypothetical protein